MIELEHFERIFPVYLSDASKIRLATSLLNWRENVHYFAHGWEGPAEPIQGDGWSNFLLVDADGERHKVSGIVCSNSCDIDATNPATRSRNVLFAPITPLEQYVARLRRASIPTSRIDAHIQSVKKQEKTELFYLPGSQRIPECVVVLDEIRPQPLVSFLDHTAEKLLFRLNNFGFYMFLMKLAIHFSRFGEKIDREMEPHLPR